ncbi:DUF6351 family protein [Variovorax sp. UMC13]|uniref:DUF6351 family protein n=1 Tax=Variovorax sp. UMC13 TaxID=1862326 RepID=UPI001600635B|nr:DUF6351 family protein [Variovorax sp. UMC13]
MRVQSRFIFHATAAAVAAGLLVGCGGSGGGDATSPPTPGGGGTPPVVSGPLVLKTLSNRADMISDGDALVEVVLPTGLAVADVRLDLDGSDVTGAFTRRDNGRVMGLLTGLRNGENLLTATVKGKAGGARLAITNFSRGGNIFAGAPIQPWVCATRTGSPATVSPAGTNLSGTTTTRVSGLDADAVDADCNAPTKYSYYYQPKAKEGSACTFTVGDPNACLLPYAADARPKDADIADFTNDRGDTVKALLRVELGTMGRGMYQIATWFDPAQPWTPWAPQKGWNGKLLWKMGASASGNRFQQQPGSAIFDDNALRAGFATVNSQLTNHQDNNNEVLATENIMMVKEHLIDTYGEVRYTMSDGGSGGSMMQTVPASVMRGLLDGLQTGVSYPDAVSTWMETRECGMLTHYYDTPAGSALSPTARAAVNGHPSATHCFIWSLSFVNPQDPKLPDNCGNGFPAGIVYDPRLRPTGVRCSIHDVLTPVIGTVTDTDRTVKPNLPYDNAGVQYGLKALQAGAITPEEFVALNEGVGSYDLDMAWSGGSATAPVIPAPRARVSPTAMVPFYKSGLVSVGRNLAQVPIIDLRPEMGPDIHMAWRSYSQRARLDAANGGHGNHVIFGSASYYVDGTALNRKAFRTMDRWLTAIEQDRSADAKPAKVLRNKPGDAADFCIATAGVSDAELVDVGFGSAACAVKPYESPRIVSGGPLSEDVFKCQLKPLDFASADYGSTVFTAGQQGRLRAVFSDGVCDWNKPGVGQVAWAPTSFRAGPGGQPLPAAPSSTSF